MTKTDNDTQYSNKLLQAKTTALFITIPQTTYKYTDLHQDLSNFKHTKYLITKLEQHEDKGRHIHVLITFTEQIRISAIHKVITSQVGEQRGMIDYEKPQHLLKSINYCKKEDTSVPDCPYLEFGEPPKQSVRQQNEDREALLEALAKAQQGNTDEALEDIKNIDPMRYIQYKQQIKENLMTENKTRKKYSAPSMNKDNIKLNAKQQEVWDLLQGTPKARRIIWVSGDYGSGKSFLMNYININHEYKVYNAGQSAKFDDVVYGYDEEGVIAWDLPRSYNFVDLGDALANVIEKFSDFGQVITSKKYNGKTQQVLGHVVVFSNHQPLEILRHRDIIHIDLSEAVKEQESPIHVPEPEDMKQQPDKTPFVTSTDSVISDELQPQEEPTFTVVNTLNGHPHIKAVCKRNIKTGKLSAITKYMVQLRNPKGQVITQLLDNKEQAILYCPEGYTLP